MIIKALGSSKYDDKNKNYGDCIIIINNNNAYIYDCGSIEHAQTVINELDSRNISKAILILSHNDDDHFKGVEYLIDNKRISSLYTVLLLKYKDQILDKLNDKRRNRNSIGKAITKLYDNISSLSGKVSLKDIYENYIDLNPLISFVGPSLQYAIDVVAKGIDNSQGDTIDNETITNAASVQISINNKVLLTGDASYEAIINSLKPNQYLHSYSIIQLPHHGKPKHAEKIFEENDGYNNIKYLVSDNTGNSNGGSNQLITKGHIIKNTKNKEYILFNECDIDSNSNLTCKTLGDINETFLTKRFGYIF